MEVLPCPGPRSHPGAAGWVVPHGHSLWAAGEGLNHGRTRGIAAGRAECGWEGGEQCLKAWCLNALALKGSCLPRAYLQTDALLETHFF